ncbi:MAG TPA: NlpC/P60 family protein [Actinomycetales bacterium]|nr:NlpC/P60 family protein [Actinomycetales bacterium]
MSVSAPLPAFSASPVQPGRHRRPRARIRIRRLLTVASLTLTLGVPLAAPAAADPTPPATKAGTTASPKLRLGSRGPAVVTLQRLLRVPADGVFGRGTRRAVVAFQRTSHLTGDGVVGAPTWRALRARAAAPRRTVKVSRSTTRVSLGARAVVEAARHVGKPYVYGAAGPDAFDCSGFVQYVYSRLGVALPRTSRAQAVVARPVVQADRQLGDLMIFRIGGRVTHVGIYAGEDTMWVARRTGTMITRQRLWTSAYSVGRFGSAAPRGTTRQSSPSASSAPRR